MNEILLLIGMWFALFFLIAYLIGITETTEELKEGTSWILIVSFIITTAVTCITGGIIL